MKLIDKDKIVAELEKCYNECLKRAKVIDSDYWIAKADAYRNVLVILDDTLEVKEVDLEEEAELIANDIMIGVQANRYNTVVYNTKRCDFNHSHLMLAARKGIELGLKAYKGK